MQVVHTHAPLQMEAARREEQARLMTQKPWDKGLMSGAHAGASGGGGGGGGGAGGSSGGGGGAGRVDVAFLFASPLLHNGWPVDRVNFDRDIKALQRALKQGGRAARDGGGRAGQA